MRVDSAFIDPKAASVTGDVAISAPPAIITSASPYWIMRMLKPMLCVPVVHAVTMAMFGPRNPYRIDTLPEIMLMTLAGTKNGDTRRGPLSSSTECVSSIVRMPPIPEPIATPITVAIRRVRFNTRVGDRLHCSRHSVLNERIDAARFLSIHVLRRVESLDRRAELHRVIGSVERQ